MRAFFVLFLFFLCVLRTAFEFGCVITKEKERKRKNNKKNAYSTVPPITKAGWIFGSLGVESTLYLFRFVFVVVAGKRPDAVL